MKKVLLIAILIGIAFAVRNTKSFAQFAETTNPSFGGQQPPVQQQPATSKHLLKEDSAAINALVLYPDNIRLDIFEACEFPASVVSIATLQKNTSSDFTNLVSNYSKEEQEDFWNLSRYPDLVTSIAQGGAKSNDQMNDILANYPQDIHDAAMKQAKSHYDVIQSMDQLQSNTNTQFEQILTDYPPVTANALKDLVKYPEIINLLNDHLSLAVRVGDHYRRDPQWVINWADSLNLVEVRQNAESADAWKQSIEQNPDEANDLKAASTDYAKENGYSQDEINAAPNPDYVSNYTCTPYSYWYGYPTWYPYSYWYPYPFWFDCGFYYDRFGHMVIFGTPSFYFTNWYFYSPEHWQRYPYLADRYVSHFYGPRRLATSNSVLVHNWVRDNRSYLPKDFVTNNTGRVESIRQVAQLNVDARKENSGRPLSPEARDQYFKSNATRYPALSYSPQTRMQAQDRQPSMIQQPEKQPPVRIPKPEQQQAAPRGRQQGAQTNFNKINKAQDYHRAVWQQTQPAQRQQMQQAPRQAPSGGRSSGGGGGRR